MVLRDHSSPIFLFPKGGGGKSGVRHNPRNRARLVSSVSPLDSIDQDEFGETLIASSSDLECVQSCACLVVASQPDSRLLRHLSLRLSLGIPLVRFLSGFLLIYIFPYIQQSRHRLQNSRSHQRASSRSVMPGWASTGTSGTASNSSPISRRASVSASL